MIAPVCMRISALIRRMTAPDNAKLSRGIPMNILTIMRPSTAIMPAKTKPVIKLKSLLVLTAYAESPRKIPAVPPSAVATICGPLANDRYRPTIGPVPNPSKPVTRKITPRPDIEFAVRGNTNIPRTIDAIRHIKYAPVPTRIVIAIDAIRALKASVADRSK